MRNATPETTIRAVLAAYERGEIRFDFPACPLVDVMRTVLEAPANGRAPEGEDKLAGAKSQGQAQFDSILEMVQALEDPADRIEELETKRDELESESDRADWSRGDAGRELHELQGWSREDAEQRIHEDALSVEVRSGWIAPGNTEAGMEWRPEEYRILLCTGGPACQIVGTLNEHCEPVTAVMQVQDWFQPWTDFRPIADKAEHAKDKFSGYDSEPTLLVYARCFWFGE